MVVMSGQDGKAALGPLEQVRAAGCDAERPGVYGDGKGGYTCRCSVCGRCGKHTGNSHQGHYWAYCKVQAAREREAGRVGMEAGMREFHFCCPGDCELEKEGGDGQA